MRKEKYPENWPEISRQVRDEAHNRCEWCAAPNGQVIRRHDHAWRARLHNRKEAYLIDWELVPVVMETTGEDIPSAELSWTRLRFHKLTRIILTTAHLDRNPQNNERSNLAALCQRCHLRHDIYQHIANRKYGVDHKEDHQLKIDFNPAPDTPDNFQH